jgi:hypothetical protein
MPPHVSLQPEVPENDGGQEIVHPAVSHHHGWPNLTLHAPPPLNLVVQAAPNHSPVQSSHTNKILNTEAHHACDKGKVIAPPSLPSNDSDKSVASQMHLRDDCSHVISEIKPKDSAQPKANSRKSRGDSSNQGLYRRLENMAFEFYVIYCFMTIDFMDFGQHVLFWIHEYYFEIFSNFMS